ncbi:hypothetical protein Tco_0019576 [Tanacetum coccineum]
MHTARGDGVSIIKRRRQDLHHEGVRDLVTTPGRGRLKEDLESSTWRRHHDFKATYLAFRRHLEEIHVTWAHLEKKRTRLRIYTNISQDFYLEAGDGVTDYTRRRHNPSQGGVTRSLDGVRLYLFASRYPEYIRRCLIKLENQVQRLMEAHLAPMQPTQVNKITSSCEICSGPHDTQYCMENPEQAFIDYASSRTDKTQEDPRSSKWNFTSTNDPTKEELRGKGIKSPSKLLSLKYLSQSSLAEQNRNPSSPKCVHFVNLIVILNREDEAKEEGNVKSSTTEYEDHKMSVESEEEFKEETKEEIKEEEEDSPRHFDTFPIMKELKYHEWLIEKTLPTIGRVKGLKVFVGNFTSQCDLSRLEDTTSVIDHDLRKFLIKNEEEIFTVRGDGVGIKPDGVASPAIVNPKVSLYISYPADFTLGVVVFVFDLQVIFDEKKLGSS